MPPKGKARAKSTSVGAKARPKAGARAGAAAGASSPEPKAGAKAAASSDPAKERVENLLRECLVPEDIAGVDGRVLEIAVLDGRSKKVDQALLSKAEARLTEWRAFQEELALRAEELRAEKEATLARHDEDNVLFSAACDARKALKTRIEELFSAVEDSDLDRVRAWVADFVTAPLEAAAEVRSWVADFASAALEATAGDGADDCEGARSLAPQMAPPLPLDCEDHEANTPLSEAACYGEVEIVEFLLGQGAHINARNSFGKTALWRAAYNGHEEVARLLLDRGADPKIESNTGEEAGKHGTPATKAMLADWSPEQTAERQLQQQTSLQRLPKPWPRLLMEASQSGDAAAVQRVAESALITRQGEGAQAGVLLRTVVDFENMADALWSACTVGHLDVVQVLLSSRADADSCSDAGKTCLMMACRKGHTAIGKALLESGAKTQLRSAEDRLAVEYAREAGHDALHDHLLEHCRRTRDWSTLEEDASRSGGNKVSSADGVECVLDSRRNTVASNRASAELRSLGAEELRAGSERKAQLLEERALADVLGLG